MAFKKTRYARKRRSPKKVKTVPKSVKKYVNKQIHKNIENKGTTVQVDYDVVNTSFSTTGYDLLANMYRDVDETLVTGNGQVNQGMLGLQCRLRSLNIDYSIFGAGLTGQQPYATCNWGRILVVMDNQASNNTALQLYNNASAFDNLILQTNLIHSPFQMNKKRYKVLADRHFMISQATNNHTTGKIRINLKNTLLQYFPTTASFFELNKKIKLYIVGYNDQGGAAGTLPIFQFFSRLQFQDA
jgi:hypothetical protein